jgi:hypothetical protein
MKSKLSNLRPQNVKISRRCISGVFLHVMSGPGFLDPYHRVVSGQPIMRSSARADRNTVVYCVRWHSHYSGMTSMALMQG